MFNHLIVLRNIENPLNYNFRPQLQDQPQLQILTTTTTNNIFRPQLQDQP